MSRAARLNLLMLAVVAGLALLAFYEPGIETAPQGPLRLSDQANAAVSHITIARREQGEVELERRGERWWMASPIEAPASRYRIDSLLGVARAEVLGRYEENISWADYGLAEPAITLHFDSGLSIAFGREASELRRYVRVGDSLLLISDTAYYQLIGDATTFLDTQVVPEGALFSALELPELTLRFAEGGWQLDPEPETFSADAVALLVETWRNARAAQVTPYSVEPEGTTVAGVTLQLADGRKLELRLSEQQGELIIANPALGVQYHFPGGEAQALLTLPPAPGAEHLEAPGTSVLPPAAPDHAH